MKKIYNGYKAFEYLEAGVDYKPFEMVKEFGRVEPYVVEVSQAEEERVKRLINENMVISLHDHPQLYPQNNDELADYSRDGRAIIAYEGLAQSGLDCVFDNLFDGTTIITSKRGWKWMDVIHDLGMRLSDIDHQDFVIVARTVDDIITAKETGRLAFVMTIESATPIENELERIEILYGFGVRLMGITYSQSNALGDGLNEPRDGGLTNLGRGAVKLMNKIGMAIDVSHCGDQTALDTIDLSEKPVIISHAGARALWETRRLKPDEVIKACAENGGVIGIEAAPHTTLTKNNTEHSIEPFMEHFEYCVNLVGIDHVTFGPDTLYGDHVALHHAFASYFRSGRKRITPKPFAEVPYVRGLENPTECFPNIVRWLVKHGYSDEDIKKVIGGNTLRVLREIWYK